MAKRGAAFYALRAVGAQRVRLALFDAAGRPLAEVSLNKSGHDGAFFCQMTGPGGRTDWVRLEVAKEGRLSSAVLTSSAGGSLKVRVVAAPDGHEGGAGYTFNGLPLKSVSVYRGGRWEPIRLGLKGAVPNAGGDPSEFGPLREEEAQLYSTPELKLLRGALAHLDAMTERGVREAKEGVFGAEPGASTECTVYCFRVATLIPLFFCDGGKLYNCRCPRGRGYFFIGNCVLNAFCFPDCNEFDGGIAFTSGDCSSLGYYWNTAEGVCLDSPENEGDCTAAGLYWDFLSGTCAGGASSGDCADPPPTYPCSEFIPETSCPYYIDHMSGECRVTPVLVDVAGDGFRLTDAAGGVRFDFYGNPGGAPARLSWTAPGSDDAWLALDRNGNGMIDSGREMFGNAAPQPALPAGRQKNGFNALAVYDGPGRGGNTDGVIDERDSVYASLRLWRDANHDGVSQAGELHALPELGVGSISLDYKEVGRRDRYGNLFRYQAAVGGEGGRTTRRLAYDVFLVPGP
jgi:hypothetical protein